MFRIPQPGLHFLSAGAAWENAFRGALAFLAQNEKGLLLLGPAIGASAKAWLQEQSLSERPLQLRTRVQDWGEWGKGRARAQALGAGQGFRVLNLPRKRELFRTVLAALEANGSFAHLTGLWQEERFFRSLLECVEEARMAGLQEEGAVGRARELLANGADAVTRDAYDDLWKLLLAYEASLGIEGGLYDGAALFRLASEPTDPATEVDLFLLGFDHLSLLEADLAQGVARARAVFLPLALAEDVLRKIVAGQEPGAETAPAFLARSLVTGFVGPVVVEKSVDSASSSVALPRHFLLAGHAPSEEARAAAALARLAIAEGGEARFVVDPRWLEEESVAAAFREELGLPRNFFSRRPLAQPIGRFFFHVLELKERQYELGLGLELAELLQFTLGKFSGVPAAATRAGIRKGLYDWKRKASERSDQELTAFATLLDEIDRLLPLRASASQFARAVEAIAELCGIAELARRAEENEIERDAHAALASLVRNAQLIAAGAQQELSFSEWLREWEALLRQAVVGESPSFFPQLQFFRYGEWLPPASSEALTLLLGFQAGVGPRRGFSFFFEESARRKLSDLLLVSQGQEDLGFFDQIGRSARQGRVLFSYSRHDGVGKELQPSWVTSALPLEPRDWPEVARSLEGCAPFRAQATVRTPPPSLPTFSASLLELYKECPFKAFSLKVLRLEDKIQASSLDISDLARGNLVHKTLELFYGEQRGKEIQEPAERERVLDLCLERAMAAQKVEYFKGSDELLRVQVRRLRQMLLQFLAGDQENYSAFPFFGQPLVEHKVAGLLGGKFPWEGKIDRVDLDEANRRFLVLDYKTGATTPKSSEIERLERFQLSLYLDAIAAERPGWQPIGALYVSLKTGERKQGLVRKDFNRTKKSAPADTHYFQFHHAVGALQDDAEFHALREVTRAEAVRIAEQVEQGVFDVAPIAEEVCKRCEVRPACRIRELRAPERRSWPRRIPEAEFAELLRATVPVPPEAAKKKKCFNEEQTDALARVGQLVFIEASAGTGKTTVIVERIRLFLQARLEAGDPLHRAIEGFAAISFTEKSAQELAHRLGASLLGEEGLGPRAAAQAIQQVSTIHGFCRRVLSDFPVEAGVSPMAELLDERGSEALRAAAFDEFFLHPPEETLASLEALFALYPRAKVEGLLRKLLEQRMLLRNDIALYQQWIAGEIAAPGSLLQPGEERVALGHLFQASTAFQNVYDQLKRARDVLDFNDLEALALKVLEQEHCRVFYRERFALLLVDEFQDTNSVQREILERLAQPGWKNFFVVGDAKQSIYRFRAADVSVFQNLRREAEARGELVTLFRNYRSRREVVAGANRITAAIFPTAGDPSGKEFEAVAACSQAERGGGGRVSVVEYGEPGEKLSADAKRAQEAELVVRVVQEQLASGRRPGEIAVLLRKLSSNDAYLQALTQAGIPFRVGSSKGFYSQQVILDGIALLRAFYGASNDLAILTLLRSPWARWSDSQIFALQKRGPARTPLVELWQEEEAPLLFAWKKSAAFLSCAELLARAYRHYPLDRREHLQTVKLLAILSKMEAEGLARTEAIERLSHWAGWEAEESALDDSTMPEPGSGGAVQVMTVHASKGLEFEVTILPDLVAGLLPDRSALRVVPGVGMALKLEEEDKPPAYAEVGERNKERDLAESKRLLYVAFTRAKEECVLLLPREGETPKRKNENWADFLRGSGLLEECVLRDGEGLSRVARMDEPDVAADLGVPERSVSIEPLRARLETSITELAAYQFCPEFHRRKFVQGWDDRIVGLWPKHSLALRKRTGTAASASREDKAYATKLLRALALERKERGIALHRVLERLRQPALDVELGRLWLTEAYEAQGANVESPHFHELAVLDLQLLTRFLASSLGQELFSPAARAYPEITFQWKVGGAFLHGAIDRLIHKPDGSWVVVDYKSSILEESRERYEFQVASYMAAVVAHGEASGSGPVCISGFLVDLYESKSYPVTGSAAAAELKVRAEIARARENYTLARAEALLRMRQLEGGAHCLKCAYGLHCEIGLKVLEFK